MYGVQGRVGRARGSRRPTGARAELIRLFIARYDDYGGTPVSTKSMQSTSITMPTSA